MRLDRIFILVVFVPHLHLRFLESAFDRQAIIGLHVKGIINYVRFSSHKFA